MFSYASTCYMQAGGALMSELLYCVQQKFGRNVEGNNFCKCIHLKPKIRIQMCSTASLIWPLIWNTNVIWHHFDFSNFLLSFCGISKMITDLAVELFVTVAVEVLRRLSTFGLYYLQPSHSFLHSTLLDFSILSFLPLIILHNFWTWQEAIMNTNQTSITPTKRWKGWFST